MKLTYRIFEISEKTAYFSEDYQYWIILYGNGQFCSSDGEIFLKAHEVLDIPAGLQLEVSPDDTMRVGCVNLQDFESNHHTVERKSAADTELLRKVFLFAIDFTGLEEAHSADLMRYVDQLMYEALLKTGLKEYRMNQQIAIAITELNTHIFDPDFDINKLVENSGYSQSYFRKMFRQETGVSPVEFIMLQRMDRAKYLLGGERPCTVKKAAEECCFRDVYYFSRVFKKYVGVSPETYKKNGKRGE